MSNIIVKLDNICKKYDKKYIIKDLNLDICEGEFITLLGPSGCGKTTILRMISGLESVTDGKVFLDGKDVTNIDPTKREVNTIFQNLALFPTMSVKDNISFGLRMKNVPKKEIEARVNKIIKFVKLEGLENRLPSQLSGGQQQRVAIARGVVLNPKVLLLDESLCSLDLKLKKQMQVELKKLQKKLGLTFIYVTHNQDEALTMSDRIAIVNNGVIEQLDTPQNIYKYPKTTFVADFIGESNLLSGEVININESSASLNIKGLNIKIDNDDNYKVGEKVHIMIRPENIDVFTGKVRGSIEGIIDDIIYDGSLTKLVVNINEQLNLKINVKDCDLYEKDMIIYIKIERDNIIPIRRVTYEKN